MDLRERLQRDWWQPRLTALTAALLPLEGLYRLLSATHRLSYRLGLLKTERLPVPVVVVGNLIVGGAGKTPTVLALVQALRAAGRQPGVVSRGYGRTGRETLLVDAVTEPAASGDEPLLIHLRGQVAVAVGTDRAAAARQLLAVHPEVDVVVCDDGLQHHRLARDVQWIVFDDRGDGNGHCLPAGPLREPLPRHLPAASQVLYNADRITTALPGHPMHRSLQGLVSLQDWWRGERATPEAWHELRGRTVWAVAGMAHPEKFFSMLRAQGLLLRELPLPDHHPYHALPWPADAQHVVLTEKDAVKLRPADVAAGSTSRVWVAPLDLHLPAASLEPMLARLHAFRRETKE
jgi:tetraacyldisaccharide 4'-kinase